MTKYILILLALLSENSLSQKKVEDYFYLISKAEDKIITSELDSSIYYYELAFTKYQTPFVRELFQATIISSYLDDKSTFYQYLKKCMNRGCSDLDLQIFRKRFSKDSTYNSIVSNPNFEISYLESIDSTIYKYFSGIDIDDQVRTRESICLNDVLNTEKRNYLALRDRYISGVQNLGWPSEKKIGIGNIVMGGFFNDSSDIPDNFNRHLISFDFNEPCGKNLAIFTNPSWNRNFRYQNSRKGNGFLWHHLERLDTILLDVIYEGLDSLMIHPLFVAQSLERSYESDYDFLLGMGSTFYMKKLKYNAKKKYQIIEERKTVNYQTHSIRNS